jgi:hypothetical protein
MLINTSVPNFAGGVSQQPDSQRLPNQQEEMENAVPFLVGGLTKRPPTNHVAEIKDSSGSSLDVSSAFTHVVTRDSSEEFMVSIEADRSSATAGIHVTDLNSGAAKTVKYDLGSDSYLRSATPQDSFRAVTIGDVTFLLNKEKTVLKDATVSTSFSRGTASLEREGFIWIKESGSGSTHRVSIKYVDYTGAETEAYVEVRHTPQIKDLGSSQFSFETTPPSATQIADVLVNGTNAVIPGKDVSTAANLLTNLGLALFYKKGTAAGEVTVTSSETFGGLNALLGHLDATPNEDEIVDAGHVGSVIFIKAKENGPLRPAGGTSKDFTLTAEDSFGGRGMSVIKDSVQDFSELPPISKHNYIVKVEGNPDEEIDDYFVKFRTNGEADFGKGTWVETVGPGLSFRWDYDTMPHILIRQSDGTFIVKRADGTTSADTSVTPAGSDYSDFKFSDRESGDDLTNPFPSFTDKKINNIGFFRNRLALLSGENVILSESAQFFNFFRLTVVQLLDSAVIDLAVGGSEVNELQESQAFNDRLIMFSERTQFALRADGGLSPRTAVINQVTNYDVSTKVSPVPAGRSLFFAFNRGSFSGIREFYKTGENDIQFDAVESTAQAPRYIVGEVAKMTVSTHEDILAIIARSSGATTDTIYIYKFFNAGTQRVQSAWCKFTFSDATIVDIHFIENALFIVMKRGSKTFIERMDLQSGLTDDGVSYVTCLDRRIKVTLGTLTESEINAMYNSTRKGWNIQLTDNGRTGTAKYTVASGEAMSVVSQDGEIMTTLTEPAVSDAGFVTISEKPASDEVFYIGKSYTMKCELTKPIMKTPSTGGGVQAITSGRHQVRYMTVVFDETASFTVQVTPLVGGDDGTTSIYPFSGRFLNAGAFLGSVPSETGDFRFPIFSQSDAVKIEILNDTPLPSNIQSVEFESYYTNRARQRM